MEYVQDVERALDVIQSVLRADPDQLMRSFETLRKEQRDIVEAINMLRREVSIQNRLLAASA